MFKPSVDYYQDQDISDLVPRADKAKAPYLIAMADDLISRLVTGRPDLRRLRDFYEGRRSPSAFQHLTSNYGIGNPGKVPFIPIVRPRIEYLKGKYLESGIPHQIACSNSYALGLRQQEQNDMFVQELTRRLTADLQQRAQQAQQGGPQVGGPALLTQQELKRLAEQGINFQSSLEIASSQVLREFIDNPEFHTITNMQDHLENLLVERESAFDTRPGEPGMLARHVVVPAGELYCDAPRKARFSTNATAFVRRQLLSTQYVLQEWGSKISPEERRTIAGEKCIAGPWQNLPLGGEKYLDFYRNDQGEPVLHTEEYRRWVGEQDGSRSNLHEVFTCQWIATNEIDLDDTEALPAGVAEQQLSAEQLYVGAGHHIDNVADKGKKKKKRTRFVQHLYEVIRIGNNIYPEMGEVPNAMRPTNEPWRVQPTFRRYSLDVSVIEKTLDAQDKSDIFNYLAENAASLSGTKGSVVPTSDIPLELGNDIHSRVRAASGYRKIGIQLINPMQKGGTKGQFSNYQSYDDTLSGDTLTGYRTFIEMYDEQVSNVIGVNRQMLGAIAERDGKAVTEQAITGGTTVTKPIFVLFDLLMGEAFTDLLNASRQSLLAGAPTTNSMLLLGAAGRNMFLLDAKKFSLGYYHVSVRDGQKQKEQLDTMVKMATEFAGAGQLAPEAAVESVFIDSATEAKQHLLAGLRENTASQLQQLQQQNEQLTKENEQLKKAQQANGQVQDAVAQQQVKNDTDRVAIEARAQATDARQGDEENALRAQEVALQRDQAVSNASKQSEKVADLK